MDEKPQRRRIRFGLRTLFELIAVAAFILTLIYYRTPVVTEKAGRYQLYVVSNGVRREKWVINTETGQIWMNESEYGSWKKASPPIPTE